MYMDERMDGLGGWMDVRECMNSRGKGRRHRKGESSYLCPAFGEEPADFVGIDVPLGILWQVEERSCLGTVDFEVCRGSAVSRVGRIGGADVGDFEDHVGIAIERPKANAEILHAHSYMRNISTLAFCESGDGNFDQRRGYRTIKSRILEEVGMNSDMSAPVSIRGDPARRLIGIIKGRAVRVETHGVMSGTVGVAVEAQLADEDLEEGKIKVSDAIDGVLAVGRVGRVDSLQIALGIDTDTYMAAVVG